MTFKKIAYHLHLWIGMVSGLIMFVVCITGAIWAVGINGWVGSVSKTQKVSAEDSRLLPPSLLLAISQDSLKGNNPSVIKYSKGESVTIRVYGEGGIALDQNPYTGDILNIEHFGVEYEMSFWDYMRWGHRALWLPWEIGRTIVNYGTLAFLIVLVTGLVIWMPKTRKGLKNRLCLNWDSRMTFKRKIYDLHIVLGFYTCFLLIVLCVTGMVWGLEWWSEGLYKSTTGMSLPEWEVAHSDTLNANMIESDLSLNIDKILEKLASENPHAESISINYPDPSDMSSAIVATVSHDRKVLYNTDNYSFDRYTLQEIELEGPYYGKYADKNAGDKLRRQNYDLHIGAVWGNVGRVLMFFAALFGASLPLTGYYIYFKVKKKRRKPKIA